MKNALAQSADLLGDTIPPAAPAREPTSNPAYVAAIWKSIERTLQGSRFEELVHEIKLGSFVRLESRDRIDFVGREIIASFIDVDQPQHSCISVAKWIDGIRTELVVPISEVTRVVPPLQARYAFDRLDRADAPTGARQ